MVNTLTLDVRSGELSAATLLPLCCHLRDGQTCSIVQHPVHRRDGAECRAFISLPPRIGTSFLGEVFASEIDF